MTLDPSIERFRDAIASGTVDEIRNVRQNRFTHILLLREVTGPARFTTDGERLNTTPIRVGNPDRGHTQEVRVVDLFNRKQPGAERRRGKALQRDLLGDLDDRCANDRMHPNEMEQNSPESVLFGSAAGAESISQRSRVYYSSAYTLRDATVTTRQATQTASGDEMRVNASDEQGTWRPGFVNPGAFLPCIVTLDSLTVEEVLFTLAVIIRTKRYGGYETRGGNMQNHVLGIFPGTKDSPGNMELTRETVGALAEQRPEPYHKAISEVTSATTLSLNMVQNAVRSAYTKLRERDGLAATPGVPKSVIDDVLSVLHTDEQMQEIMETQLEQVDAYIDRFEQTAETRDV